ncbi:MAG: hypothetical protein NVS1B13_08910 [Flavisolibacter sp.]
MIYLMKKFKPSALAILVLLSLSTCTKFNLFSSQGRIIIEQRPAEAFDGILLNNNINLILTQDTIESIRVEAGENIQSSILTQIHNHLLTISRTGSTILSKPGELINVYTSVKEIKKISYQGSGNITSTNTLNSSYFLIISNNGAGNVTLSLKTHMTTAGIYNENADFILVGQSDSCYSYCASRGTLDFRNFEVKKLQIDYSGARDAYVWVRDVLTGNIFYKGNIYIRGNPSIVSLKQRSEGKLYPF